MYTVINVILGIPITRELEQHVNATQEDREWEDFGFEEFYHGSSDFTPGYCGVLLKSIDMLGDPFPLSDIQLTPTKEQSEEALKLVKAIPIGIKMGCLPFGLYVVESTS